MSSPLGPAIAGTDLAHSDADREEVEDRLEETREHDQPETAVHEHVSGQHVLSADSADAWRCDASVQRRRHTRSRFWKKCRAMKAPMSR